MQSGGADGQCASVRHDFKLNELFHGCKESSGGSSSDGKIAGLFRCFSLFGCLFLLGSTISGIGSYLPAMLSKSQFRRRLRRIPESVVWRGLMNQLAAPFHESDSLRIYLADSFPVPVCRNIRIKRCKIYQDECFRGRVSSRKEYIFTG